MVQELLKTFDEIQAAAPRVLVWGDSCYDRYRFAHKEGERYILESEDCYPDVEEENGMAAAVELACKSIAGTFVRLYAGHSSPLIHERIVVPGQPPIWIEIPPPHKPTEWSRYIAKDVSQYNVLLVSDYGRGTVTPAGLRAVIDAASAAGVPVLVDPHRQTDWERYRGASVIKCSSDLWHSVDYDEADYLLESAVVVTEGGNGMRLFPADAAPEVRFPTEPIPNAHDCGAGDVVLAALGCAVAAGVDLAHACRFANVVAGLKCRKLGPLALSPAELRAALG